MTTTVEGVGVPATRRGDLSVAAPLAAVGVLAALAAVVLVTRAELWDLASLAELPVDAVIGVSYAATGAVLVGVGREGGGRRLGWLLLAVGVCSGVEALAAAIAATAESVTVLAQAASSVESWLWVPGFMPLLTFLPLLYPDGRLPGRRWLPVAVAGATGIALMTLGAAFFPDTFHGQVDIEKPFTSDATSRVFFLLGAALLVPASGASVASLFVRLRRATGLARQQILVFLVAAAVVVVNTALQPVLPDPAGVLSQAFAVVLLPVAVAVAVTRHRLYELDLAVRRALVGISLAGCLAGVYLTGFALLRGLFGGQQVVASALAAGLTGLLVQPLVVRLSRGADRLFYGDRADPYAVLARLSARLRERDDDLAVPQTVCDTVVESLRLGSAELRLAGRETGRPVGSAGTVRGASESFELRHRGELVGELDVTPREGERELDARDRELLAAVADQVAPAVSALRLYTALQASREALVAGREEERRRLRHDLHDGVGAALAGVRLQLDTARELVAEPTAARLIEAAGSGVAEAVADVRRVTEDLRPPSLDELGLAGSLASLAARWRTPSLNVQVEVPELPQLPAAVEVACYRIAAEALANAARHSAGRTASLRLSVDPAVLTLTVADDGVGLRTSRRGGGGLGLASMRTRAEEIGGEFVMSTSAAGTVVTAVLPR
jgi:signal transduction histidine kinase